jgi:hypothetical protein
LSRQHGHRRTERALTNKGRRNRAFDREPPLERYAEPLGGKLEIHAVFDDDDGKLTA